MREELNFGKVKKYGLFIVYVYARRTGVGLGKGNCELC